MVPGIRNTHSKNPTTTVYNPDIAAWIFFELQDIIGDLIAFVVNDRQVEMVKTIIFPVEKLYPFARCTDPQTAFTVFKQSGDGIVCQRKRIVGMMAPGFKIVAVIAVESILCGNPEKTVAGLQHIINHTLRQPVFNRKLLQCQ